MSKVLIEEQYLHDIADSIRKMTGKKDLITTDSMANEIEQAEIVWNPEEKWVRPIDMPDYSQIDISDFEGMYYTYDTSTADPSKKREWVALYCSCPGGFDVSRGQIINGAFVAEDTVYTTSGGVFREWLPQTITGYVVYRLTPHTNGNHITSIGMREISNTHTGDGFNSTAYYQKVLERYGRLPYLTSFSTWGNCTTLSDTILDLKVLTTMNSTFTYSYAVENIDLTGFNSTPNSFYNCFYACRRLRYLNNTDKFVTSTCTNIQGIFYDCLNLRYVDTSTWDTQNVTSFNGSFYNCISLYKIDVSNFVTNKVTNFSSTFGSCQKLKTLDVSSFNTSNATTMYNMFGGCNRLEIIDVSGFDTGKVTNMAYMFSGCQSVRTLDVSGFNTANVTTMEYMFQNCRFLQDLDVSNFNTEKVTTVRQMFYCCGSLKQLDFSNFDLPVCTYINSMCEQAAFDIESLTFKQNMTSGVLNNSYFGAAFSSLYRIKELDLSWCNMTNITTAGSLFRYDYMLEKVILPDTCKYIGTYWFGDCRCLKTVVLPSTTLVTLNNTNAFSGASRAKTIYVPDNLVESYRTANNWKSLTNVTFAGISTYED